MTDDEVETNYQEIVTQIAKTGFSTTGPTTEQLSGMTAEMDRRYAERKEAEKAYAIPGLDVPWYAPAEYGPIKVWEHSNGIVCAIACGGGMPSINGYCLLPKDHPWSRFDLSRDYGDGAPEVAVHGGITWQHHATGWIGFDTNHGWDHWDWSYLTELREQGLIRDTSWERWSKFQEFERKYALEAGLYEKYGGDESTNHIGHNPDGEGWDRCKHWTLEDLVLEVEDLARQVRAAMPDE